MRRRSKLLGGTASALALLTLTASMGGLEVSGLPEALAARPDAPPGPGPAPYVVGFHEMPSELARGHYQGDSVRRADPVLRAAVVLARDPARFEAEARNDANVRYAYHDDPAAYRPLQSAPNDPYFGIQSGLDRIAWPGIPEGNARLGVVVAVLDTGIERTHEDFRPSDTLPGWDFAAWDPDPGDDCGHGTHVAGILGAATNNGLGIAGVAQPTILPVKVMHLLSDSLGCAGSFSDIAFGIRYAADQGARVITMSLGCNRCYDPATSEALEYAWSKGAVLVASAGNSGPCGSCVGFPANHPRVLAVACTDQTDATCSFSSRGPEVAMAAPGSGIVSTYLGNRYARLSGTSMSAPFVAAGAAMALAANPGLSNAEVASLLRTTATDLGLPGRDDATGAGLLHLTRLLAAARAANDPPLAAFRAAPKNETLNVNASGSSDADGTIVAHSWEWGDGSRGMGAKASHLYGNPGTYTVRLVVTDDDGATGTTTQRVVITAPLHVGSIAGNSAHINATQHRVAFRVTVADAEGAPVAGAQVSGNLTTPSGRTVALTATSNTTGVARLAFDDPATSHGTYRLCVTAITKAGWRYDSASNTARCAELATT